MWVMKYSVDGYACIKDIPSILYIAIHGFAEGEPYVK